MFYFETARQMGDQIAVHYHPGADDPVGNLTVPELLGRDRIGGPQTCASSSSSTCRAATCSPSTTGEQAQQLHKVVSDRQQVYWAILGRLQTRSRRGARFAASQIGMSQPDEAVCSRTLYGWFYTRLRPSARDPYLIDYEQRPAARQAWRRYRQLLEETRSGAEARCAGAGGGGGPLAAGQGPTMRSSRGGAGGGDAGRAGEGGQVEPGQRHPGGGQGEENGRNPDDRSAVSRYEVTTAGACQPRCVLYDTVGLRPRRSEGRPGGEDRRDGPAVRPAVSGAARDPIREAGPTSTCWRLTARLVRRPPGRKTSPPIIGGDE